MATTRPRITITLTDRQHAVLRSLSSSGGQSMSSYVVEFLELALPTLERVAATLQALASARETDIQRVRGQIEEAQRVFEPLAMAVVSQGDMFLGRVEQAVSGTARAPHATAAGSSSPRTNRGVTPTPAKPSKPKPRAASGQVRSRSQKTEKRGSQ
jgi:hypothetical protein